MMNALTSLTAIWMALSSPKGLPPSHICEPRCIVSPQGINLIEHFEGYSPFVYKDAVGYPTIGWGHLLKPGEHFAKPLLPIDGELLLRSDLKGFEKDINNLVTIKMRQAWFDSLASFTFNVGTGNLKKSTMLKKINQSKHKEVPVEMKKWNKAKGKELRGLTIRRELEAKKYEEGLP